MEYKSRSFRSSDRAKKSETPNKYTIEFTEVNDVQEIRLGTIELPRTQYIVEDGYNNLNFSEGFKLGSNGIQYTDPNNTQETTMVYVPNYLSAIESVTDASEEEWVVTTYLPWDVRHYFQWKKSRENLGDVVPDLMLLGADTRDPTNPVVVLTEANFTPINTTYPNRRKCGIYNCTEFRIKKEGVNIDAVATLYLHRAPWHVPELLDFINYCIGSQVISMTEDGKFNITNYSSETPIFQFINEADALFTDWADGSIMSMPGINELPFRIQGDRSTSDKVAPKMMATLPVGDYRAGDVATLLPQFMSLGHLNANAEFDVMIGLQTYTITVEKGTYSTPFLFNEAIRLALQKALVALVDCEYTGISATAIFNDTQYPLGRFRFFSSNEQPFMLDFSRSTLELINALNVDAIQYGPAVMIDSKNNITWPNFLGVAFSNYKYDMSSTVPATQKYCIKAFNPSHVNFQAHVFKPQNSCMLFMTQFNKVLPYQPNDVCFLEISDLNNKTTTARVVGIGYVFKLTISPADAANISMGDLILQTMTNGRQVLALVQAVDNATGIVTVYSLFNIDNDQFEAGTIQNAYTGDVYNVSVCNNCKQLGMIMQVGCHVNVDQLINQTYQMRTGFIDCPRFEMQFETESLAPRLGIPMVTQYPITTGTSVSIPRMSGSNFYLMTNQYNLDPIPYLLLIVKTDINNNPKQMHFHNNISDTPLAKLIMQTPFTITRNQIMEVSYPFGKIEQLQIEFQNPDGSPVNFHGREHSMTLGFVCGRRKQ